MTTAVTPALVLLDVDGTLLHAGGAGRRALEVAMEAHLGPAVRPQESWLGPLKLDGMTDRLIVREAMVALGRPFDEALCDRILATYVGGLAAHLGPGYAVLPGVEALLEALTARGVPFGLCTGNVAAGARAKLAHGGLDRWFAWDPGAVHGFAEDGEARERLVAAALRRAAAHLGRPLAPAEVLVVGDTPRDVHAARAVGCRSLGVATGRFDVAALRAEGADHAVPTLEQAHVMPLLFGVRYPGA